MGGWVCVKSILFKLRISGLCSVGRLRVPGPREGPVDGLDLRFPIGWSRTNLPPTDMLTVTPQAARQLAELLAARAPTPGAGLRLAVRRGGCAGWQYEMQVAEAQPGDHIIECPGARVIVAADSLDRLQGCEIDYSDALSDAGFKVNNPNARRSCGCGTSFEPADEPPGLAEIPEGQDCTTPDS